MANNGETLTVYRDATGKIHDKREDMARANLMKRIWDIPEDQLHGAELERQRKEQSQGFMRRPPSDDGVMGKILGLMERVALGFYITKRRELIQALIDAYESDMGLTKGGESR